jgi:hypothetical protein
MQLETVHLLVQVVLSISSKWFRRSRPSGFVDLVLICACACAVLADTDGSVVISTDLGFLAVPGGSPPSLVRCVA